MNFLCSMECNKKDFCSSWCIVGSECRLTNFLISPQDGPQDSDHLICYSNRRPGNHILKATVSSSDSLRPPSLLTKGIFNLYWQTTSSLLSEGLNPYVLFEFPSEIWVKTVHFLIGIDSNGHPSAQTELRLGSSMPGPIDFSQLELIGTFDNPQRGEHRTFTVDPPKRAKFLAILETDGTMLEIRFLEVLS